MTLPRFFTTATFEGTGVLPLGAHDVHHARDVLRLTPGDELLAVAPDGAALIVRVSAVGSVIEGTVVGSRSATQLPRVWLAQALAKGEKMDTVIRQTTELGVETIVPFVAERSVVRLTEGKAAARTERWRRIAESAAKQAQRSCVPSIREVVALDDLPVALAEADVVLVCWEEAEGIGVRDALEGCPSGAAVAVVVGPEGGLTAGEVAALVAAGARAVTLGATHLRTETAGVVAVALAAHELGGVGGRARA